jgi:hypothetical protein
MIALGDAVENVGAEMETGFKNLFTIVENGTALSDTGCAIAQHIPLDLFTV